MAPSLLAAALLAGARLAAAAAGATCPGLVDVGGFGPASVVPTGWVPNAGPKDVPAEVEAANGSQVIPHMGGRAYFADDCSAGVYNHSQYLAFNLLGKTMRFTTDVSGAKCGCNAALYLTSMRQNEHPSDCFDFYCDANNVCGQSCAEIDIMEANMFAWHSTLHSATDHSGLGVGYGGGGEGWSGPRNWKASEYGPGASCIDTARPFEVAVSFPADGNCQLLAMQVTLSQAGRSCPLSLRIDHYPGMWELSAALGAGMTPIVSYWNSHDMLWMDGKGDDRQGPCSVDTPKDCGETVRFYDFSIGSIPGTQCASKLTDQRPATPKQPETPKEVKAVKNVTEDVTEVKRLREPGAADGSAAASEALVAVAGYFAGAVTMALVFAGIALVKKNRWGGPGQGGGRPSVPAEGGQGGPLRARPSSAGLLAMAAGDGKST